MFQDRELARLGADRDRLFRKVKALREQRDGIARRLTRLHREIDEAYARQHELHNLMEADWTQYQQKLVPIRPEIEFAKAEVDRLRRLKEYRLRKAGEALDNGLQDEAESWEKAGHVAELDQKEARVELNRWINRQKSAQDVFNKGAKKDFDESKSKIAGLKQNLTDSVEEIRAVKALIKTTQDESDQASRAFDERLKVLKGQQGKSNSKPPTTLKIIRGHEAREA